MMLSPRRLLLTSSALVLVAFFVTVGASRRAVTMTTRTRAELAARRLDTVMSRGGDSTRALVLSYLERARLGLGSPFRLIDQSLHDARLSDSNRLDVAWAIIDRMLDRRVYEVDSRALDLLGEPGVGQAHLRLIEQTIGESDDPRMAEAAVRIAYGLAAANGTTGINSNIVVADVASQIRDRVLALRDLRRAIPRADDDGVDLIDELLHLRTTRELSVEAPLLMPLTESQRATAIDDAASLLREIEALRPGFHEPVDGARTLMDKQSAFALARLAPRLPPLGVARVIATGRGATLRADSTLPRDAASVIASASNEESIVAAYAYADRVSGGRSATLPRLMLALGVGLRAHAQDRIWFPGEPSPSVGSVVGRFGLKGITFDRAIPSAWRPFYTQMIAAGLDDFSRALPGYDAAGLSFRVEAAALPDSALAMHDPRTRTIRLSAFTPSGTLAHELAHDADWQAARRLFAKSGGYATDRAVHDSNLQLSSSMRGLTAARVASRGRISPHGSSRPAEVFARSVDWFVADALAAMGRSNGFLSAIEDPLMAGFATTPVDAPSLGAANALVRGLAEITYVPDSVTGAYVQRWRSLDRLDPATVLNRVMEVPMITRRERRLPFGYPSWLAADLTASAMCRVASLAKGSPQDRLVAMTIEARARGIVLRRARYTAEGNRPAWARAMLGDPMYSSAGAEDQIRRATAAIAEGAAQAGLIELPPAPFRATCE